MVNTWASLITAPFLASHWSFSILWICRRVQYIDGKFIWKWLKRTARWARPTLCYSCCKEDDKRTSSKKTPGKNMKRSERSWKWLRSSARISLAFHFSFLTNDLGIWPLLSLGSSPGFFFYLTAPVSTISSSTFHIHFHHNLDT